MGILVGYLVVAAMWAPVLAYVPIQVYSLVRLDGWLRGVAILPVLVMAPVIWLTVNAYNEQSNLWPVPLITTSFIVDVHLLVLNFIARTARRRQVLESSIKSVS